MEARGAKSEVESVVEVEVEFHAGGFQWLGNNVEFKVLGSWWDPGFEVELVSKARRRGSMIGQWGSWCMTWELKVAEAGRILVLSPPHGRPCCIGKKFRRRVR
jgi:hypothetical protein